MTQPLALKTTLSRSFRPVVSTALLGALATLLALPPAAGQERTTPLANIDVRLSAGVGRRVGPNAGDAVMIQRQRAIADNLARGVSRLKAAVPGAEVTLSALTGGPEMVSATGALTSAVPGRSGLAIVRDFLEGHAPLYGLGEADLARLNFKGESVSEASGLRMVRVEQTVAGRPVFQSETRFTLDRDGRLVRSVGLLVPEAAATTAPLTPSLSAPAALAIALASVNLTLDPSRITLRDAPDGGRAGDARSEIIAGHPQIIRPVTSELVYFPAAPGVLLLAWSQVTMTSTDAGDWYTLVDANAGVLLWRKNIRAHASTQQARFRVYVQADGTTPADSPSPLSPSTASPGAALQPPAISRTVVSMSSAQNLTASPNGWITDGANTTTGNNVDAYLDLNADSVPDPGILENNGRPVGNVDAAGRNRDFLGTGYTYTPPPNSGNPESGSSTTDTQHRRGAVTQLFYLSNWYHDRLYSLGFDAAAGNFQVNNFGAGGAGNDPILAEAQDAAGVAPAGSNRNNANFSTPPDGQPGRMQMYLFDGPGVDRDGALDGEIVIHELTHGLTNRLIGNGSGLNWDIGGGLGEGWSDFYALSLLNHSNADNPNGNYATGAYATYKLSGQLDNYLYGIRRFPYSTNNAVNPLTWGDLDDITFNPAGGIATSPLNFSAGGAFELHNIGEVWCTTLWEVRSRIIADPAGANGSVPVGNNRTLQIVTDAMKMTPINPSFPDARNALIAADAATNNGANEKSIWQGFADRGLGYNAVAPYSRMFAYRAGHMGIGQSFDLPYLDVHGVAIDDSLGNANGAIDPGETVRITVTLINPWRATAFGIASAAATLSSATAGVTMNVDHASYPAIAPLGHAAGTPFQFIAPAGATAGQALKFTLTATSALGTRAVDFTLRVGTPAGNGPPIIFTRTLQGGLAIPDAAPRGVSDAMTINEDLEIADLNFRIDQLVHPWVGDITALLRGPNGLGTDLISTLGGLSADGGSGGNFVNTVVDDQATGDLLITPASSAPFTGSWKPAFNASSWGSAIGAADPAGQLSRYNGLSTQGTWNVLVSDQQPGNTGALFGWSLIITPKAYTIAPVTTRTIALSGDLSFGSVPAGGMATRTLTIANPGSSTLNISSIVYPIGFSGNWSSGAIPAGGSHDVTVNFFPAAAMSYGGNVTVGADHTSGVNTIAAAGTGVTASTVQFSSAAYSVAENAGTITLAISRAGNGAGAASVDYATSNGSAFAPADFLATAGTLNWADGDTSPRAIIITITDDAMGDDGENFIVTLSNPSGGNTALGDPHVTSVVIVDDDSPTAEFAYVTNAVLGTLRNDYTGWIGMQFTVGTAPLSIARLGRIVAPGNTGTHQVRLVRASDGLGVPGGSVAVSTSGGAAGQFRYVTLASPVTLAAGTTYWLLSLETAGGDFWHDGDTALSTTGVAAVDGLVWGTGPGDWGTVAAANHSGMPVNFTYSPAGTSGRTLTIASSGLASAVDVAISPLDQAGRGNGTTTLTRTYNSATLVTLTAPLLVAGSHFQKWRKDGVDWSTSPSTTVAMEADHTMTALYTGPAVYITSVAPGSLRNDFTGWVGMQITVGANALAVSELGRMVAPANHGSHALKLVRASDRLDLAGGSVVVATSGGTAGQFLYGMLNRPVMLAANTTYWLVTAETIGGDQWYHSDTMVFTTDVAADNGYVWEASPGVWGTDLATNRGVGPVNFKYSIAPIEFVTSTELGTLRNDYSGWVGMQFTVGSSPLNVRELGRMMAPGNRGTHVLKLVKASDGLDVPGGSVSIATSGGTTGQFQYAVLASPVTLAAGATYWLLSEEASGGDAWYHSDTAVTTTTAAVDNGYTWGSGPGFWGTTLVLNRGAVPVSFKY